MPFLVYQDQVFKLTRSQSFIGSSESCHMTLDANLKPTHALIEEGNGAFWISAINRLSEVYVNGKKVRRHPLRHQDQIMVGEALLTYHLYSDPPQSQVTYTQERLDAYQKLYEFSQKIAEHQHSDELFEVILEEIIHLTQADQGLLVSVHNDEKRLRAIVDHFHPNESYQDVTHLSESIVNQVCASRVPLLQDDLLNEDNFKDSESILEMGLCSVMCAPLIFKGELLGVIYVGHHRPTLQFQPEDLKTLCIFSAQAATLLKHALTQEALEDDNTRLREELEGYHFGALIGASTVMREVFTQIERVSRTDVSVLITGETGTGKELIAREIHHRSERASGPFVAINCGAIPATLIESELFGYRQGAFTGALLDKQGSLESANGGTLFLDEIGEMPLELQVRLLRVIETREVKPLGTHKSTPLDIRLICATNRKLFEETEQGSFRKDLYYRINVVDLQLPPLRDRGEDVVMIAKYILDRYTERFQQESKKFSEETLRGILRYSWPGNIRELENRIAQAVVLSESQSLNLSDLNLSPEMLGDTVLSLHEARERFTLDYISHVLTLNSGNRSQAARDLNVDPRTVFRYLEKMKV